MAKVYLTHALHGEAGELQKRLQFTVQSILKKSSVIQVLTGLYILLVDPRIQIVGQVHIRQVNRIAFTALSKRVNIMSNGRNQLITVLQHRKLLLTAVKVKTNAAITFLNAHRLHLESRQRRTGIRLRPIFRAPDSAV